MIGTKDVGKDKHLRDWKAGPSITSMVSAHGTPVPFARTNAIFGIGDRD